MRYVKHGRKIQGKNLVLQGYVLKNLSSSWHLQRRKHKAQMIIESKKAALSAAYNNYEFRMNTVPLTSAI